MPTPSLTPPKIQTPQINPPSKIKSNPLGRIQCIKCQGFRHISSDYVHQKIVTLVDQTATKEEKIQKEKGVVKLEEEEDDESPEEVIKGSQ